MSEPIQIVTVTISTALGVDDPKVAEQQVLETLEFEDFTFGAPGQMLPFQLESIETRTTTEEEMPRP